MPSLSRRRVLFAAGPLVLAGGLYLVLTWLARAMLYPGDPTPLPERVALGDGRVAERVEYRAQDGAPLCGLWLAPRGQAPVVLYLHGNAESAAQQADVLDALGEGGRGVLLAEYRGYGGCAGSPTEAGLYADAEGALGEIGRRGVGLEGVILFGRSLGTGVAVEMAVRHDVRGMVLVSPYTSMPDLARRHYPIVPRSAVAAVLPDRFDSMAKAVRLHVPTVVLHGSSDDVVPFDMGERLARAIPRARFVRLDGVAHNDVYQLALDRVIDALREVAR